MVFLPNCSCKYLKDLYCIELRDLNQDRPKGAKRRGYTKNPMVWDRYPPRWDRYGILLKPNNLIVVDIDYPDKKSYKDFPPTFTVKTGGGGFHLYYWNIDDLPSNHRVEWGEIKTTGHVCGVGVLHPSGNTYDIEENIPITTLEGAELKDILGDSNPDGSVNHAADKTTNINPDNSDLDFIKSREKRKKVLRILEDPNPPHNDRLWLVGFLNYIGLSEICINNVISQYNKWSDFDRFITKKQIRSVVRGGKN